MKRVDFQVTPHYYLMVIHALYLIYPCIHHLKVHSFFPLTHSRPKTHPHTPQKSIPNSLSLEEQSSLLLQKFRESRSFTRRIHHQNHYLGKLMLGSMLWTPSYLQKSLLNSHEIINLCLRTPQTRDLQEKGGQKSPSFLPSSLQKPKLHPKVSFILPIFLFYKFCVGGGGIQVKV